MKEYNKLKVWRFICMAALFIWFGCAEASIDDHPPEAPHNPNPANNATAVPLDADLSWDSAGESSPPYIFDVYLGTSTDPPRILSEFPDHVWTGFSGTPNTKYYWRVVAKDGVGRMTSGPLWSFTTGDNPTP